MQAEMAVKPVMGQPVSPTQPLAQTGLAGLHTAANLYIRQRNECCSCAGSRFEVFDADTSRSMMYVEDAHGCCGKMDSCLHASVFHVHTSEQKRDNIAEIETQDMCSRCEVVKEYRVFTTQPRRELIGKVRSKEVGCQCGTVMRADLETGERPLGEMVMTRSCSQWQPKVFMMGEPLDGMEVTRKGWAEHDNQYHVPLGGVQMTGYEKLVLISSLLMADAVHSDHSEYRYHG